ncbi:MAG: thioredoxin family protein [Candidatus Bathyarchaeia archaeon]
MNLIPEEHKGHIKSEFEEKLEKTVRIVMFTQEVECQYCAQTRQLLNEIAALSDKINLEVYDFVADAEKAKEYGVDKVPAIAIIGEKDYGVRFYGLPYGYELQTLLEGIIAVSKAKTDLPDEIKTRLKEIKAPVHIQVFVTLTCPYCPIVASLAHKFAVESDLIRADVIEVGEFPHLGFKYGVLGVPKTVINEKVEFVGALPEDLFLEHIILAAV